MSFYPGHRALPAGILPEQDLQMERAVCSAGRAAHGRGGYLGLRELTEYPVCPEGLGELHLVQHGFHLFQEFYGAVEAVSIRDIRVIHPPGQYAILIVIDADDCGAVLVFPLGTIQLFHLPPVDRKYYSTHRLQKQ